MKNLKRFLRHIAALGILSGLPVAGWAGSVVISPAGVTIAASGGATPYNVVMSSCVTSAATASSSYVATTFSGTITHAATSKIRISVTGSLTASAILNISMATIYNDTAATDLLTSGSGLGPMSVTAHSSNYDAPTSTQFVDLPGGTSTTYRVYIKMYSGTGNCGWSSTPSVMILEELPQ